MTDEPNRYNIAAVLKAAIREGGLISEERMAEIVAENAPEIPEDRRPFAVKELTSGFAAGGYVLLGTLYKGLVAAGQKADAEEMVEGIVGGDSAWIDDDKGEGRYKLFMDEDEGGDPDFEIIGKV